MEASEKLFTRARHITKRKQQFIEVPKKNFSKKTCKEISSQVHLTKWKQNLSKEPSKRLAKKASTNQP